MPREGQGDFPLPSGWEVGQDFDGKVYFIDHHNKKTTWIDPRDSFTKAQTFADCVGHELPYGWEECYDPQIGIYYINHVNQENQIEDPRVKWRDVQEQMLNEYLQSAQEDLAAKQDIMDVKSQRLALAKDHYHQLNRTFSNVYSSKSSVNSSGSSTKMDPEALKVDLARAKSRVSKLKRELHCIKHEVDTTEMGVHSLAQVKEKLSNLTSGYTLDQARAIVCELRSIEDSLRVGQQEKAELIQSLTLLGEDLREIDIEEESDKSSPGVPQEKSSIASQTDFCGELQVGPLGGAQLAELTRLKLDYEATKTQIKNLQHKLVSLEQHISPIEVESDRDRLLLIQEKEQLLKEVRLMHDRSTQPSQISDLKEKIWQLEFDLTQVLKMNNQAVEDRLRIQERRRDVVVGLRESLKRMLSLEKQLKSISASTLSVSSSSSSLGSLSTSSKGSASSLSFTDIFSQDFYGGIDRGSSALQQLSGSVDSSGGSVVSSTEASGSSVSTLHRRVERLLQANSESDRRYAEKLRSLEEVSETVVSPETGARHRILSQSMLSLSPRSSLSSLSPPGDLLHVEDVGDLTGVEVDLGLLPQSISRTVSFDTVGEVSSSLEQDRVSEFCGGEAKKEGDDDEGLVMPSMSAAVSDESVAGDSGVYEAVTKGSNSPDCLETPQVQIKLWYKKLENLLFVGIEKARNLSSLVFEERSKVCVKVQLFPAGMSNFTCCTHLDNELSKPTFGETFSFQVSPRRLPSKTVQVNVWSVRDTVDNEIPEEECVGYAQISLADSSLESPLIRWYNVLSYALLRADSVSREVKEELSSKSSTLRSSASNFKEESSDESTIISSQTSTLTRNIGPEAVRLNLCLSSEFQDQIDSDEEEENEEPVEAYVEDDPADSFVITADKETNTECMFSPLPPSGVKGAAANSPSRVSLRGIPAVKRSQTFTPSAVVSKTSYRCRLNRSDSDSCVPVNRKAAFERGTPERKSLRWRRGGRSSSLRLPSRATVAAASKEPRTSLDLELDLAAQQLRLHQLRDEIEGLKNLKSRLQEAKDSPEVPAWATNSEMSSTVKNLAVQSSPEDRRLKRILRRTSREIHKLRHSQSPRDQVDLVSFKEKMAFFLKSSAPVPTIDVDLDAELDAHEESSIENVSGVPSSISASTSSTQGPTTVTPPDSTSRIHSPLKSPQGAKSFSLRLSEPPSYASSTSVVHSSISFLSPHLPVSPSTAKPLAPVPEYVSTDVVKHTLSIAVPGDSASSSRGSEQGRYTSKTVLNVTSPEVPYSGALNPLAESASNETGSALSTKVYHPNVLLDASEKGVEV